MQLFDYKSKDACDEDIGRCVRVPFGKGEKNGVVVALPSVADVDAERLKTVIQIQREVSALPDDWLALVGFVARYYHAPLGEVIALALPPGLRRADAVEGKDTDPFVDLTPAGRAALQEVRRPSRALSLMQELSASGVLRRSMVRALPSGAALGNVSKRGWLEAVEGPGRAQVSGHLPELTVEQQMAVDNVAGRSDRYAVWLLQGVTGSGKTEIYLRLAQKMLQQGKQVLMLVPEIALTPQLESRVCTRFPGATIVSLHSGMGDGARSRGFVQALEGRADIVLGTRLAVFVPLPRLGLILVDEEHDASYKQQEGIRYSARDVAIWRARQRNVPVVLGSATPSLESWQHARDGRYRWLRLDSRASGVALPKVRCIDTKRALLDEGISPALKTALDDRLQRGEQALVFINRRGYAPVLSCTACGWISHCVHCSANLVVHLADRRLRCHHCGFDAPLPLSCPQCGNQDVQPFGRGTQRVEARLNELFPQARVLRLDRDAVKSRTQWEMLLGRIAAGEADILIGTQMMAKGHDFPALTLVGVIGADASLHAADFRAPERLFQQLMQVGGRAGRAHLPGEVLIHTEYPDHSLYHCLVRHDFDAFATAQLDERRQAGFPPYTYQAMLRADAPALEDAEAFLVHARRLGLTLVTPQIRIFDPVPMRMHRLARRERAQLLVEGDDRITLQGFLRAWQAVLREQRTARALRWQLDVDPLDV